MDVSAPLVSWTFSVFQDFLGESSMQARLKVHGPRLSHAHSSWLGGLKVIQISLAQGVKRPSAFSGKSHRVSTSGPPAKTWYVFFTWK